MKKNFLTTMLLCTLFGMISLFVVQADPFAYVGVRYHSRVGDGWNEPERQIDGYYLFDLESHQQVESVVLGDPFVSTLWYGIALNPSGTELYVGGISGDIGVIDTSSGRFINILTVDQRLAMRNLFFNRAGDRVYAHGDSGDLNHDHLFEIDATTHQIVRQVDLNGPLGLGNVYSVNYDQSNNLIFCLHEGEPATLSILRPDFTLDRSMALALPQNLESPEAIIISPDGRRAYVSFSLAPNDQSGEIEVVEISTGNILSRIPVQNESIFLRLNHSGNRLIILDYSRGFTVLDTADNSILFQQNPIVGLLGAGPDRGLLIGSVDISEDDRKVLIGFDTQDNEGGLFVFDLENQTFEEEIMLHGQPWSVIFDHVEPDNADADLRIALRNEPEPVPVGRRLTYTVTVHNEGEGRARDVSVTLTIPNRFSFVEAEPVQINPAVAGENPCQFNGLTLTCSGFDIRQGRDMVLGVVAVAPRNLNKDVEFFDVNAQVQSGNRDPNPNNNQVSIRTNVQDRNWWQRMESQRINNIFRKFQKPSKSKAPAQNIPWR